MNFPFRDCREEAAIKNGWKLDQITDKETSMDLKVGDRVKVKDSDFTKQSPRNLAGRYGHVEVLNNTERGWEARIAFNDFKFWIRTEDLQKCSR